jgi:DNA-binding transcriptional LysR family regulator
MTRFDRIPLEAFRVFEAAARRLNFTAAAQELGVTQAAVSRRVQGLEAALGAQLFARRGRRLALTPEGARLMARTRAALDHLAEAVESFAPAARPLSLAAPGSVSHLWLDAALRRFADARPDIPVRVLTTDAMGELASEAHDVAILYAAGEHPRWRLTPLLPERLAPVASAVPEGCGAHRAGLCRAPVRRLGAAAGRRARGPAGRGRGPDGARFDIQLKGAGRTPYSRMGDGRAWLGPRPARIHRVGGDGGPWHPHHPRARRRDHR